MIDYLVITVYLIVLIIAAALLMHGLLWKKSSALFNNPWHSQALSFLLVTLPVVLYFAILERSSWQATLGKHVMGLKVVSIEGARLRTLQALSRSIVKFLPWELAHTCIWHIKGWPSAEVEVGPMVTAGLTLVWVIIGANLVCFFMSKTRQTLYDRLTASVVVVATRWDKRDTMSRRIL